MLKLRSDFSNCTTHMQHIYLYELQNILPHDNTKVNIVQVYGNICTKKVIPSALQEALCKSWGYPSGGYGKAYPSEYRAILKAK